MTQLTIMLHIIAEANHVNLRFSLTYCGLIKEQLS